MKNTHVIIPLSVYDDLKKEYDSLTDNSMESMMKKALLTGKMSMLYAPEFIRFNAIGNIDLLAHANYTLNLTEIDNSVGIDLSQIDEQ